MFHMILIKMFFLKLFHIMERYKQLTGSVSEGSFSRNCTIQYASWARKKEKGQHVKSHTAKAECTAQHISKAPGSGFNDTITSFKLSGKIRLLNFIHLKLESSYVAQAGPELLSK